jgi:hypothetical protein
MKTPDRNGYDYVRFLVRENYRKLQLLELRHGKMLIPSADYRSCRRSVLQAISQLESLLRHRPKHDLLGGRMGGRANQSDQVSPDVETSEEIQP